MGKKAVNRILIVRLSAIGDVVLTSPLIAALKRTWPETHISWLVEEAAAPLLEYHPDLEEVIVWPRQQWLRMWSEGRILRLIDAIWTFIRNLRVKRFDLVLDVQGLFKSGLWAFLSGARERIGLGSKEGSRLFMTRVVDRAGATDWIGSQYLLFAEELHLEVGDFSMVLTLDPEAERSGNEFASSMASRYVVLSPFTTRPQKHWVEERWKDLVSRIIKKMDLAVVLLGGTGNEESALRIQPENEARAVNLVGKTTIQHAAAIIKHASLLVGVDTGLTHMGIALSVPTIALFGATRPYLNTKGTSGRVLYHPHECSPCHRNPTCDGEFPCMEAITTDEVMKNAMDILGET